jgi:hypothetical protein
MTNWKPIEEEIRHKVLVTNNIDGRNSMGNMSHIWVAILVQYDTGPDKAGWITFDEADRKIWGLTHYAEIPK